MTRRLKRISTLLALTIGIGGCTAGNALKQGDAAMKAGDVDQAVAYYRTAVQDEPNNPNYKIALERAMAASSRLHLERAKEFEDKDQLEAALGEYKLASEMDPSNRVAAAKVGALDRTIRDRIEASRPKPAIQALRERARLAAAEPLLNPASREPLNIRFTNASLRDVLNFIANATGINVMYDRDFADRPTTVQLDGVTLEQALTQILTTNQYAYKVVNSRTILVFPDTPAKHAQYDEQVVRTFYLSHSDATEVSQVLSGIIRLPGLAVQPAMIPNKASNSITVRATAPVVDIIEKIIAQNDKPRAEIVVDVEILEVDRNRVKQYGLNLSEYAVGGIFSPEVSPTVTVAPATGTTAAGGVNTGTAAAGGNVGGTTSTANSSAPRTPSQALSASPPVINLNTILHGLTTSDFYLAVPTAVVRFLESDVHTKTIAKPQLRGAEGTKLTLKLGSSIPVISTSYTPIATGGAGVNPLSSYTYRDIGVNIDMTPRVTLEGDIIMDLSLDDSAQGPDSTVAGLTIPSFVQRTVTTRLRLRDGESNLLAGLMREDSAKGVSGFPGAIHVPGLKQLLSANTENSSQTDIVMLLTPHVVRSHEITEEDLRPVFIGSQQNLGLAGGPTFIGPQGDTEVPPAAAPPAAAAGVPPQPGFPQTSLGGTVVTAPPGSSPVPGTVVVPAQPPAQTLPAPGAPPTTAPVTPSGAPSTTTPSATTPAVAPPATAAPAATTPAPATGAPPATTTAPAGAAAPPTDQPFTTSGIGSAQVLLSPPGTAFRVGGGPYTVPISISNVSRLSMITLTLTFDPAILRVRSVQEGSFMRSGGVNATFTQQVAPGRVDITIVRSADATGASGAGLLAAILFDAVAPGSATMTLSGSGTGPGGTTMGLQFRPVTVVVQ